MGDKEGSIITPISKGGVEVKISQNETMVKNKEKLEYSITSLKTKYFFLIFA